MQKFLDNCTKCGKIIENETIRPKESGKPYHADCFCCTKCGVSLQGKYFNVAGEMLCEDDFAVSKNHLLKGQKISKIIVVSSILPQNFCSSI